MVEVKYKYLLNRETLYSILEQGLNYYGLLHICNETYKKNKDIYNNDVTFKSLNKRECFIKDIIQAIEYTDYALTEIYQKCRTIKDVKLATLSQKELAAYVCCALYITRAAYGNSYLVGLSQTQKGFIRSIPFDLINISCTFDDEMIDFAMDILGEMRTVQTIKSNIKGF